MKDDQQPKVRATDSPEAQERIDLHVKNDALRWWYIVWAVIALFIVVAVLSIAFLAILNKANDNSNTANRAANHATAAICIEIAYLDAVSNQSRLLIKTDPDPTRQAVRLQQLAFTKELTGFLKSEIPKCPKYRFKNKLEVPTATPSATPSTTPSATP
jgi:hypothetical protein